MVTIPDLPLTAELVQGAVELEDRVYGGREVFVEPGQDLLGRHGFHQILEVGHLGEHHRDAAQLAAGVHAVRGFENLFGNRARKV